ncbi:hypothetical protein OAN94_08195 [Verrucomicrobiales bacterium]|jgi:acyl carrier protein|nr:hypothetical protein [Verrucomicrobiales bacterium]MDC0504245.1 hypothetical protein [Verrucomicrobiales bacterium]
MTLEREELVKKLAELLADAPETVNEDPALESLSDWDSMGQIEVISMLDSIQVSLKLITLEECQTIGDLLKGRDPPQTKSG